MMQQVDTCYHYGKQHVESVISCVWKVWVWLLAQIPEYIIIYH